MKTINGSTQNAFLSIQVSHGDQMDENWFSLLLLLGYIAMALFHMEFQYLTQRSIREPIVNSFQLVVPFWSEE